MYNPKRQNARGSEQHREDNMEKSSELLRVLTVSYSSLPVSSAISPYVTKLHRA